MMLVSVIDVCQFVSMVTQFVIGNFHSESPTYVNTPTDAEQQAVMGRSEVAVKSKPLTRIKTKHSQPTVIHLQSLCSDQDITRCILMWTGAGQSLFISQRDVEVNSLCFQVPYGYRQMLCRIK